MFYALLCILFSTVIVLVFRALRDRSASLLQSITVNYWVCVGCGLLVTPDYAGQLSASDGGWLPLGLLQGALFISMFFLIGWAAQRVGVAYTAVVTRVSVVFPAMISVLFFGEEGTPQRWLGLGLAILAVLLLHVKYFRKSAAPVAGQPSVGLIALLGAVLFFGTGATDTLFKVFEHHHGDSLPGNVFTITLFGVAGCIGLAATGVQALRGRERLSARNLLAGLALGVPNYLSIYFLLMALREMPGVVFFPVNNVGVLLCTTLVGVLYYREPFRGPSWLGLALAVVSIVLIAWEA